MAQYKKDIFLSHASEDKETFVKELHERLTDAGYKIWYDENEIAWGDELEQKIEQGLTESQYGIVVISKNYFDKKKEWTFREFDNIYTAGKILPILHEIDIQTIKDKHPKEYEKIKKWKVISSAKGIDYIIEETKKKMDDNKSEKDVDYTRLRNFLRDENWKEADKETLTVMLKASGREKEGWLDGESINNFPCTDLRTIDKLWVKYSNEHFGFSVQKLIWERVEGNPDADYETYCKFADRVGWRVKETWIYPDDLIFRTSALSGHLPFLGMCRVGVAARLDRPGGAGGVGWQYLVGLVWEDLFSRVETCKVLQAPNAR